MKRRHFLVGLGAAACSPDPSSPVQSLVPGDLEGSEPADWPEAQIDADAADDLFVRSFEGTPFDELVGLGPALDDELRAITYLSPAVGAMTVDTLKLQVFPALEVSAAMRQVDDPDELGSLLAGTVDFSVHAQTMLAHLDAIDDEGIPVSPSGSEAAAASANELAEVLRGQLAIAGVQGDAFARQMVQRLDHIALALRSGQDLQTLARQALEAADAQPPPPPFAAFCTSLEYLAANISVGNVVAANATQQLGKTVFDGVNNTLTLIHVLRPLGITLGPIARILIQFGAVATVLPMLSWSPPQHIRLITNRMCACGLEE